MRVGEHGKKIRCLTLADGNTGYDMSDSTELTLVFTKPDGSTLTKTTATGVTAPAVAIESILASTYFEYTTIEGDIDQDGEWSVQGKYEDATPKCFISGTDTFTVDP